ncbi:MAG TPA: hypothetical protein EYQ82_08520 [Dehalococcoidia bacterium]|nr:hypothetical protein [Dehalococcoidia bacterium]
MRRRWILSLVVALGATGAVVGATAVSADFPDGVRGGDVLDRVASILGINRSELDDAFTQAKSELKNEKQAETLTALVDNDTLDKDEALEIGNWLDGRPEVLDGIKPGKRSVFKFHGESLDPTASILKFDIPSVSAEHLARLVEAGKFSQEDADAIQTWLDARPESVDKLVPDPMTAFEGNAPFGDGISPFDGRFFRFGGELDLDGLRERLKGARKDHPEFHGEIPDSRRFKLPEGGFSQFDGDGFELEFKGDGPGFFFRGGTDGDGYEGLRGFRGFGFPEGFPRFHDFTPDATNEPEPVNL